MRTDRGGRTVTGIIVLHVAASLLCEAAQYNEAWFKHDIQFQEYRVKEFELARQDIYGSAGQITQPITVESLKALTDIKKAVEKEHNAIHSDIHLGGERVNPPIGSNDSINKNTKVNGTRTTRRKRQVRLSAIRGANVWPHNVVPYYIDLSTYSTAYSKWKIKSAVSSGLRHLESVSCVKFIERTKLDIATRAKIGHGHSVRIFNGPSCWSHSGCTRCYLGQSRNTTQNLSMATRCTNDEIVQHEFGHVMGLTHEHTRTDMHKHIAVNYSLVGDPTLFYRKTHPEFINNAPYDLTSIQHYQTSALVTPDPADMWLKSGIGKLTHYDEWSINAAYCSAGCNKQACQNDGYMSTKDGGCKCVCPEGLSSVSCMTSSTEDVYGCGGVVDLQSERGQIIQTPNYPNRYAAYSACSWLVKAPAGKIIETRILSMDLPADVDGCKHYVEIRDKLIGQVAREKCGKCSNSSCFTTKSNSNKVLVIFNGLRRSNAGGGARISVRLLDDCSNCRGAPCHDGKCSPRHGDMSCGFEHGLLGECSDIRVHDSYQKSYKDLSWTESAWEIAQYGPKLSNHSAAMRSVEGRLHLLSVRPPHHTPGPYEGVFRIVPYLIYPGRPRCLKFKLFLCCDGRVSLRVHSAVRGQLGTTPLLTVSSVSRKWREMSLQVEAPSHLTKGEGVEMVFISSHTVSSRQGQSHLGIDNIEWRYGRCH